MAKNIVYTDLDLNFVAHPVTGDVSRKFNEDSIKQSIRNLVLTNHFERPFHSEIGTPIRGLLFDLSSPMLVILLKKSIRDVIENFEPRVELIDVQVGVRIDQNDVFVTIIFKIVNTDIPIQLDLILEKTR